MNYRVEQPRNAEHWFTGDLHEPKNSLHLINGTPEGQAIAKAVTAFIVETYGADSELIVFVEFAIGEKVDAQGNQVYVTARYTPSWCTSVAVNKNLEVEVYAD